MVMYVEMDERVSKRFVDWHENHPFVVGE